MAATARGPRQAWHARRHFQTLAYGRMRRPTLSHSGPKYSIVRRVEAGRYPATNRCGKAQRAFQVQEQPATCQVQSFQGSGATLGLCNRFLCTGRGGSVYRSVAVTSSAAGYFLALLCDLGALNFDAVTCLHFFAQHTPCIFWPDTLAAKGVAFTAIFPPEEDSKVWAFLSC